MLPVQYNLSIDKSLNKLKVDGNENLGSSKGRQQLNCSPSGIVAIEVYFKFERMVSL